MRKYKCPECGAACKTSHCYDCDKDIPFSCGFEDSSEDNGASSESGTSGYRCPKCGITWKIPYCHDCDIPLSARNSGSGLRLRGSSSNSGAAVKDTNMLFEMDDERKQFKINGENIFYSFSDLISYELFENNVVIQESGVDRAIIGGLLFGDVGAIVGAQTRGSQNAVDSLYIRISLKAGHMKRINLITSPTNRDGAFYRDMRRRADEIIASLDSIADENKRGAIDENRKRLDMASKAEKSPTLVADELLKLKQLLDMGVLTEEEFNQQKQKLLNQ